MLNEKDLAAYEGMRQQLELESPRKWIVFHDGEPVGLFDSFNDAASEAVRRFGAGPYLIRQISAPSVVLPASFLFRVSNA